MTDRAFELSSQSPALKNGALSLFEGASALAAGTGTLEASMPAMTDGIYQLFDGARPAPQAHGWSLMRMVSETDRYLWKAM